MLKAAVKLPANCSGGSYGQYSVRSHEAGIWRSVITSHIWERGGAPRKPRKVGSALSPDCKYPTKRSTPVTTALLTFCMAVVAGWSERGHRDAGDSTMARQGSSFAWATSTASRTIDKETALARYRDDSCVYVQWRAALFLRIIDQLPAWEMRSSTLIYMRYQRNQVGSSASKSFLMTLV